MKIYENISQLVGNTPLFEVKNIQKEEGVKAKILVKLEYFNPAGSIKDRASLFMLEDAKNRGVISEGATIIEATSGNTGIGLASIGASLGYKVILTMPANMSKERIKLLKAYGAQVVLTDATLGMQGAIDKANEIKEKTQNSFIASQFSNPANTLSHYQTTAREIYNDLDGKIDVLVAGIGSGGTISGIGKFLKEHDKNIKIIGVEPDSSPLISKGVFASHKLQGIGANFIPDNYDKSVVDEVMTATEKEAYYYANLMAKKEGLLVGISSGASLAIALKLAKQEAYKNKTIVAIMPDGGDRYLSGDLFE